MRKSTTIPLPRDRAYNTKLDTVLEEDNKKEEGNDAAKLKDNIFNTPATLEEYINLTAKVVEEGEDGVHF